MGNCVRQDDAQESIRKRSVTQRNGLRIRNSLNGSDRNISAFFPHGMMEAVLEEVFNRLSEHLAQGDRVTLDGLGTFSVSLKCEGAASEALFSK